MSEIPVADIPDSESAPEALKLAGVCGWPIHHSLSPVLHSFWLRHMNLKGAYVHFAVRPDTALDAFRSLKRTSITGVNVTSPLKKTAFDAADEHTPDARKLGVANCLYKRGDKLVAHNTDLEGFAAPLLQHYGAHSVMNVSALVIGTGGAAHAVIGALMALNCPEIRVIGRTPGRADALVNDVNVPSLYAVPWEDRHHWISTTGLIVNASAGGMTGKPELDVSLASAVPGTFVYDLVYTPRQTGLMKKAERHGLPHIGGLEMLIAQARPAFKLFFGQRPPDHLDPTEDLLRALKSAEKRA